VQWASGLNVIAGLWLIISPWVLGFAGYDSRMTGNNVIFGIIVAVLAAIRVYRAAGTQWLSWINVLVGIWLFISAFVFASTSLTAPFWNNIILGVIVAILGIISAWGSSPQAA
jgi:hypothetical protein